MGAMRMLRGEIAPICQKENTNRMHKLSSCIAIASHHIIRDFSGDDIVTRRLTLLRRLSDLLGSDFVLSSRCLQSLIEESLIQRRQQCLYHNSANVRMLLNSDHRCREDQIPSQELQVLKSHYSEVQLVQFSNTGRYLASSSNNNFVFIWEVNEDEVSRVSRALTGHQRPVSSIAWSLDDSQILTCGSQEAVRRWDVSTGDCYCVYENMDGLISCCWHPRGKYILAGGQDSGIYMWSLDGVSCGYFGWQRTLNTADIVATMDRHHIIYLDSDKSISLYNVNDGMNSKLIEERHYITSFSLSSEDKFLLVNLSKSKMHLWSIAGDPTLIMRYKGYTLKICEIRSCFGGLEQAFVACGSEDSKVYVWHRTTGKLLKSLQGHSATVNCVSWNPTNPHMLASASDDGTIRIWV